MNSITTDVSTRPLAGRRRATVLLLAAATVAAFLLSIALGSVSIPLSDIARIFVGAEPARSGHRTIVLLFRLPKALTALCAGAGLAVSGLIMQTLFRNPLAGPFVLGINSGASLGVALTVLAVGGVGASGLLSQLGLLGDLGTIVAASLGSAIVLLLVLIVSRRVAGVMTLLILGLLFGYAVNAVTSILIHYSVADRIQAYVAWTFGSFGGVTWQQLALLGPILAVSLVAATFLAKSLNALLLGERYAESMGLNIRRSRILIVTVTAIQAGAVTAFCGPIGFIGIAIPHLCRALMRTADHRVLLPTTMLVGACAALVADIVAQLPGAQSVLPLNAVTALVGAPVVAWVILGRRGFDRTLAG